MSHHNNIVIFSWWLELPPMQNQSAVTRPHTVPSATYPPPAQGQHQGVDQDRFTRPGFTGKHGKAVGKFELNTIYDDEITN